MAKVVMLLYPSAKLHLLKDHSTPGVLSQRRLIVLHITEGSTAAGAIATFEQSQTPHRVSAHFVIDRDGTVWQLADVNDTTWHASQVNSKSVGIEHVAHTAHYPFKDVMPCTPEQYEASAKLVQWLCEQLMLPVSRGFIKTHNEASPKDGHVFCCTGGLDPDKVVTRVQELNQTASQPPSSRP